MNGSLNEQICACVYICLFLAHLVTVSLIASVLAVCWGQE